VFPLVVGSTHTKHQAALNKSKFNKEPRRTCWERAGSLAHCSLLTGSLWCCWCWHIQGLPVNGTAQTATSGTRRIGTRVAGACRRIDAAPQDEVLMLTPV
jgi:hypothetical protein